MTTCRYCGILKAREGGGGGYKNMCAVAGGEMDTSYQATKQAGTYPGRKTKPLLLTVEKRELGKIAHQKRRRKRDPYTMTQKKAPSQGNLSYLLHSPM